MTSLSEISLELVTENKKKLNLDGKADPPPPAMLLTAINTADNRVTPITVKDPHHMTIKELKLSLKEQTGNWIARDVSLEYIEVIVKDIDGLSTTTLSDYDSVTQLHLSYRCDLYIHIISPEEYKQRGLGKVNCLAVLLCPCVCLAQLLCCGAKQYLY